MENESFLALNAALYLFAILYCIRTKKHYVVISILILYFLSAVGSIFLFSNTYFKEGKGYISFYPLIYLFIMLILMLRPLMGMKNDMSIESPNTKVLKIVIIIVFLIALPRSIQSLMNFDEVIGGLLKDPTTASVIEGVSIYDKKFGGGFNYISILGGCAFGLAPVLLMYYLSLPHKNSIIVIMLVFVFVSSALEETSKGGRGALIMFMLSISYLYILFRNIYSKKTKKKIFIFGGFVLLIFIGVFYLVSMFKHGLLEDDVRHERTLNYLSQNYIIFDSYGLDAGGVRYGTRTATMVIKLLAPDSPATYAERVARFSYMKTDESRFYTFVGDFTLDYGPIITAILFVILSAVFSKKLKIRGPMPFYKLFLVYFIMKLFLAGLFQSPYCDLGGNLQIIVYFVAYEFFKYNRGKLPVQPIN